MFAVDESVQREALKDFYEQRAQVKILKTTQRKTVDKVLITIRWRRKS